MATNQNMKLKLIVDKKANKLLFAEAGKDFADFLMSLLTLPVGSVIRLTKPKMVGCVGELYESVENLGYTFIQPGLDKNFLLNPACLNPPILLQNEVPKATRFFSCLQRHSYVAQSTATRCPSPGCGYLMSNELNFLPNNTIDAFSKGGFVKDVVTYMVTDALVVTPINSISTFLPLNKFNLNDTVVLEEKVVEVGMEEGLALLKASFQSSTAISDVFLGK
ncbi:uncharacterized protein LOC143884961 isoform X2 [Tasmannia lanceolata]|uniref:uncharacterized protein LOC143884961 isoform X2 n=1 Tax=Tasmannia lanceolata TaxID=3420 RepID=UPI0040640DCB